MLVGAKPKDLSAALNVSYDNSFESCMFSQVFLLHCTLPELHFKILLEEGKSFNHPENLVQNVFFFALVLHCFAKD